MLSRLLCCIRKPGSQEDNLSYNPMLLPILCHLNPGDINRCKLVSRRFNDVIQRNLADLPRPIGSIRIETLNTKKRDGLTDVSLVKVHFWYRYRTYRRPVAECDLLITDKTLIVRRNDLAPISKYYKNNGDRVRNKQRNTEEFAEVWRYIRDHSKLFPLKRKEELRERKKLIKAPEYRIESQIEGLCTFLSAVGTIFEIRDFEFNSQELSQWRPWEILTVPPLEEHMTRLFEVLLRSVRARNLRIWLWTPQLSRFYSKWSCKWLSVNPAADLSVFFPTLHTEDMMIQLYLDKPCFFDSLEPIVAFLKEWESGDRKLRYIGIESPFGAEPFQFSENDVERALRTLQCFSVKRCLYDRTDYSYILIYMRRQIDNKIIALRYDTTALYIKQYTFKGDYDLPLLNDFEDPMAYEWRFTERRYGTTMFPA